MVPHCPTVTSSSGCSWARAAEPTVLACIRPREGTMQTGECNDLKRICAGSEGEESQEVKVRSHVQRYLNYQLSLLICTIDGVGLFSLASLLPVDFTDPTILSMKSIL